MAISKAQQKAVAKYEAKAYDKTAMMSRNKMV